MFGETVSLPEREVSVIPPLVHATLLALPLLHETVALSPSSMLDGLTETEQVGALGLSVTVSVVSHVTLPPVPVNRAE